MGYEEKLVTIGSMKAGADLRTYQFCFVEVSADGTVNKCNAVTDLPMGILQNKPNLGEAATVAIGGISKVLLGASIAAGDKIGTSATGTAVAKTDATHFAVGIAVEDYTLQATPTGTELGSVLLLGPFRPANAS